MAAAPRRRARSRVRLGGRVAWAALGALLVCGLVVVLVGDDPPAGGAAPAPAPARSGGAAGGATPPAATRAYVDRALASTGTVADSAGRFAALVADVRLDDANWVLAVWVELTNWRLAYDEARRLEPPPGFDGWHHDYLDMLALLDEASLDVATALDTFDVGLMAEGAEKARRAAAMAASLTDRLLALT